MGKEAAKQTVIRGVVNGKEVIVTGVHITKKGNRETIVRPLGGRLEQTVKPSKVKPVTNPK